ncbi:MAG: hypothetical protein WCD36_10680 [Rhodanobacteraceae bacterium]
MRQVRNDSQQAASCLATAVAIDSTSPAKVIPIKVIPTQVIPTKVIPIKVIPTQVIPTKVILKKVIPAQAGIQYEKVRSTPKQALRAAHGALTGSRPAPG